jgi:glycosyltransferase involved in cell wall biosynthesis
MYLTVIICTHNPKKDYLTRTLQCLKEQSLDRSAWELVIIDNASRIPVEHSIDLSWHPQARLVIEPTLGLTHARLRGIRESHADMLVFVDDDNLLAPDYLEVAHRISQNHPHLGAWGGTLLPEYETNPPDWALPWLHMLALRTVERDSWSNIASWSVGTCPAGAGMCIRTSVAQEYAHRCQADSIRAELDRKGDSLVSCGDMDMAYTACDLKLGNGRLKALRLTHIIPKERLELDYLVRLNEANGLSAVLLEYVRGGTLPDCPVVRRSFLRSIKCSIDSFRRPLTVEQLAHKRISDAYANGIRKGRDLVQSMSKA